MAPTNSPPGNLPPDGDHARRRKREVIAFAVIGAAIAAALGLPLDVLNRFLTTLLALLGLPTP